MNQGERWYDFDYVRELTGLPPEVLLVPLRGHTYGHASDVYFYHQKMDRHDPWCTPGLRFYQAMMEKDCDARLANQKRLRQLRHVHGAKVEVFFSHDALEFVRLAGHGSQTPAGAVMPHMPGHAQEAFHPHSEFAG